MDFPCEPYFYKFCENLSGRSSLYLLKGVFGCQSDVLSRTALMYWKKSSLCIRHDSASVYSIALRSAPSWLPKNREFRLDMEKYLLYLSTRLLSSAVSPLLKMALMASHSFSIYSAAAASSHLGGRPGSVLMSCHERCVIAGVKESRRRRLAFHDLSVLCVGMYPVDMLDEAHGDELVSDRYPLYVRQGACLLQVEVGIVVLCPVVPPCLSGRLAFLFPAFEFLPVQQRFGHLPLGTASHEFGQSLGDALLLVQRFTFLQQGFFREAISAVSSLICSNSFISRSLAASICSFNSSMISLFVIV